MESTQPKVGRGRGRGQRPSQPIDRPSISIASAEQSNQSAACPTENKTL
jgi:hypothetical protein